MKPHILWITKNLSSILEAQANIYYPLETGGVLMGYTNERHIVVQEVINCGKNSFHSSSSFAPDQKHQEEEIEKLYNKYGRRIGYLGDWHTHPDGLAKMSRSDKRTLRSISKHSPARCTQPVMLILAGSPNGWKYHQEQIIQRKLFIFKTWTEPSKTEVKLY